MLVGFPGPVTVLGDGIERVAHQGQVDTQTVTREEELGGSGLHLGHAEFEERVEMNLLLGRYLD